MAEKIGELRIIDPDYKNDDLFNKYHTEHLLVIDVWLHENGRYSTSFSGDDTTRYVKINEVSKILAGDDERQIVFNSIPANHKKNIMYQVLMEAL